MTNEENQEVSLDIHDIERAALAIQLANKRGAYELAESGQLAGVVERLTAWTKSYRAQHEVKEQNSNEKES